MPRLAASLAVVSAVYAAACSSSGHASVTLTPIVTSVPSSEATEKPEDFGLAGQLGPAILQPADISPDFRLVQNQNKILDQRDVPGLSAGAKGAFVILTSPDKNEFVNQLMIVPNDYLATSLLDAFNVGNYIGGLAPGANDARASVTTLPGAPPGAKALIFSGTASADTSPQPINGEAVAFVHGPVFVIVVHGTYQPPKYAVDAGALASAVNARLSGIAGAN